VGLAAEAAPSGPLALRAAALRGLPESYMAEPYVRQPFQCKTV
jgi:hypothetical protein